MRNARELAIPPTPRPAPWREARTLIGANALTVVMAVVLDWPVDTLLWPFWIQSIVIGYYSRRRILALRQFSTEGFRINGRAVAPDEKTKRSTANFFALHYGLFHLAYLAFLGKEAGDMPWWQWLAIASAAASFAWNHRLSFERHLAADSRGNPNIGTLMFLPYARVVPMHLTILVGGASGLSGLTPLLAFGLLKTGADVLMHFVEHRVLQSGQGQAPRR